MVEVIIFGMTVNIGFLVFCAKHLSYNILNQSFMSYVTPHLPSSTDQQTAHLAKQLSILPESD